MADKKISQLTAATTPLAGTEVLPIVQGASTVKVQVNNLFENADSTTTGLLSSTDWNTFNGKAPAVTYTSNYIPYGQGTTTPAQSANLTFDGSLFNVIGKTQVSSLANSGGEYFNYTAAGVDSRSWRLTNDALSYGDFQIQQSTTQTGSTYETKMYFSPFNSDVTVSLGNLVIGTSGKGIDFSATAGTGTSELLADYEEGTWTPTDGSVAGLTFASASGTYTKTGRLVVLEFYVTYPVTADTNQAKLGGVPYTAVTGNLDTGGYITYTQYVGTLSLLSAGTTASFYNGNSTQITNANLSGKNIRGVIIYQA